MASRLPSELKLRIAALAGFCCECCLSPVAYSPDSFSVEHIWRRAKDGTDEPADLAFSCQGCNNRKYTATASADPITGEMVPLFHPRRDRWQDHFAWNNEYHILLGTSPTGRATIARLDLNRPGVVGLRRALRLAGVFPAKPDNT